MIGQLAVVPAQHVVSQIDQRFFLLVHWLGLLLWLRLLVLAWVEGAVSVI